MLPRMRPSSHYPVVLIPPRLQAALEAVPELPTFGLGAPQAASFPADLPAGKSFVAALFTLFGLKRQAEELLAPERLKAQQRFLAATTAYEQAKAVFEVEARAQQTPAAVRAYRRQRVAALFETSLPDAPGDSFARAGVAELHLFDTLQQVFPGRILRRRLLNTGTVYHPDYVYVDPAQRLRIDIELDEPYVLNTRLPIHYLDDDHKSVDHTRDQAFLSAGWPIIRFSEQQAVTDPLGCARQLADLIEQLIGHTTVRVNAVPPVQPHPRWTRADANRMAELHTRGPLLKDVKRAEELPVKQATPIFVPSRHQQRIFDFLRTGTGHGMVVAVAGSGKSTTLLEAIKVIRETQPNARVILLAFNRSIRGELAGKLQEAGLHNVETATFNGFGQRVLNAHRPGSQVIRHKAAAMIQQAAREVQGKSLDRVQLEKARKIFALFQSYIRLDPTNPEDVQQLSRQYKVPEAESLRQVTVRALELNVQSYQQQNTLTLDDQNYLPVKLNLPIRPYDFVFVDECQDLTQTQLELVRRAAGEHGRLLFVGDPRQAIMGFRGADNDSIEHIKALPSSPTLLDLTVSYRCPKAHVGLARRLMPSLEAAPKAAEGEVYEVGWTEAFRYIQEGDLLFARYNAGLDLMVMELLARGFTLAYEGKQTNRSSQGAEETEGSDSNRVADLIAKVRGAALTFDTAVRPHRPRVGPRDHADEVLMPWLLGQLAEQARHWDGDAFAAFVERVTQPDLRTGVRVSTAHQAKGLEARRVFVMGYGHFGQSRQDQQEWEFQQELNLQYVALTRSKHTLFLVGLPD
ncbi:UvrD-helicase domain-containing protein [Deinococcus ruber]|uniref:DNA 3'-5' helicase n=1 Tax=Deinococcus ruber TaxID=1848197 RepID=A0A918KX29_9DEIO|nr:UvrD-helicase domain-containing protein [Deinococcus ruber]GGR38535.1 hypothetical protein GCM10008957_54530 [Deinococcus ruber]